jgi:hypothetical protein
MVRPVVFVEGHDDSATDEPSSALGAVTLREAFASEAVLVARRKEARARRVRARRCRSLLEVGNELGLDLQRLEDADQLLERG